MSFRNRAISALGLLLVGCKNPQTERSTPRFEVEELGTPVVTMESAQFTAYTRAGVAHHLMFFHPMRRPMDCQVRILDCATGKVTEASGPPDRPLRMVEWDGKYYLGQYGEVAVWVYDPETMALTYKKGPDLGRLIAFSMIVGPDQKIYLGTASGDCRLIQYDPATEQFRDYGTQGPRVSGPRYAHTIATDGRFVYTAAGKNPWFLVATDIRSGEQKILLQDHIKYLSVQSGQGWAIATVTVPSSEHQPEKQVHYLLRGGTIQDWETTDALAGSPDGAMALARPGVIEYFDPADTRSVSIPLPSPSHTVSALTLRPDGTMLFSLAGSNEVFSISPPQHQIRSLGSVGPPGTMLTQIDAADHYLYVATAAKTVYAVDTQTGHATELPCGDLLQRIRGALYASERGVSYPLGNSVIVPARFRLEQGKAIPDLTYASYDLRHRCWVSPEVILDTMQPDGRFTLYWRMPGRTEWKQTEARIHALPVEIERLHALADGRLWGNTRRYQECFLFHPKGGTFAVLPGKFPLSGPCVETIGGKLYLAGYPGGTFLEYDPSRPWTLGDDPTKRKPPLESPDSNPRMRFQFSCLGDESPAHHVIASAVGADGNFYFGGHCERGAVGGGIGWWDVRAGKPGSLRKPFLVYDCAGLAPAYGAAKLIYSSTAVADPAGKIPTPPEAKLFVFDIASKTITAEHVPFPGEKSTGAILARDNLVFGFAPVSHRWTYYVFDLDAGNLVSHAPLPIEGSPYRPTWGSDGRIWLFIGSRLVRVDADTGRLTVVAESCEPGALAFVGRDLYLAGTAALRRIRNVTALTSVAVAPTKDKSDP